MSSAKIINSGSGGNQTANPQDDQLRQQAAPSLQRQLQLLQEPIVQRRYQEAIFDAQSDKFYLNEDQIPAGFAPIKIQLGSVQGELAFEKVQTHEREFQPREIMTDPEGKQVVKDANWGVKSDLVEKYALTFMMKQGKSVCKIPVEFTALADLMREGNSSALDVRGLLLQRRIYEEQVTRYQQLGGDAAQAKYDDQHPIPDTGGLTPKMIEDEWKSLQQEIEDIDAELADFASTQLLSFAEQYLQNQKNFAPPSISKMRFKDPTTANIMALSERAILELRNVEIQDSNLSYYDLGRFSNGQLAPRHSNVLLYKCIVDGMKLAAESPVDYYQRTVGTAKEPENFRPTLICDSFSFRRCSGLNANFKNLVLVGKGKWLDSNFDYANLNGAHLGLYRIRCSLRSSNLLFGHDVFVGLKQGEMPKQAQLNKIIKAFRGTVFSEAKGISSFSGVFALDNVSFPKNGRKIVGRNRRGGDITFCHHASRDLLGVAKSIDPNQHHWLYDKSNDTYTFKRINSPDQKAVIARHKDRWQIKFIYEKPGDQPEPLEDYIRELTKDIPSQDQREYLMRRADFFHRISGEELTSLENIIRYGVRFMETGGVMTDQLQIDDWANQVDEVRLKKGTLDDATKLAAQRRMHQLAV